MRILKRLLMRTINLWLVLVLILAACQPNTTDKQVKNAVL